MNILTRYPQRVSTDGTNVAIRNLRAVNPRYNGPAEWRASNGSYLTDDQVADWLPIAPVGNLAEVNFNKNTGIFDLYINGNLICGSRSAELVLADAQHHAGSDGVITNFRFTEKS